MITLEAQDLLFRKARTHNGWLAKDVPDALLRELYELMKWGPTSANCSPARIVLVKSPAAKAKLLECVGPGNVEKTKTAPVTAIIAMDKAFYEKLPQLFPHADARSWFVGNQALIDATAFRNSSLQGAYFMIAARALGLDCGPMSGFDAGKLKQAFFGDDASKEIEPNFLCNLGYGDEAKLFARRPRLSFDEACRVE